MLVAVPLIVVDGVYVSDPVVPLDVDRTVKLATPLLVFCGDDVRSVVAPVPTGVDVLENDTEKVPAVARLPCKSIMLTVASEIEDPLPTMLEGLNTHATAAGPPPVKATVVLTELTVAPSLNVTAQLEVAKLDLKTNRA